MSLLKKKYTITSAYFAKKDKNKESYTKIDKIKLEQELYIIIEGENVKDKKVFINVLDKNDTMAIVKSDDNDKLVPVLVDKEEKSKIEATFDKKDAKD